MQKKVRELKIKKKPSGLHSGLLGADGNVIFENSELTNIWKNYIKQFFVEECASVYTHHDDLNGGNYKVLKK